MKNFPLEKITYRPARFTDASDLINIKNDPDVRRFSIVTQDVIRWENHIRWLMNKLADPHHTRLFCIVYKGQVIGDVRLDISSEVEVSIRLLPEFRGKGIGEKSVRWITRCAAKAYPRLGITAKIVDGNKPSMATFLKVGYEVKYKDGNVNYLEYAE